MSAKTIFISSALPMTSVDDVRACFEEHTLGVIDKIDTKDYERDGRTLRKFWIHYSSTNELAFTKSFFDRLFDNNRRQKAGEVVTTSQVPRIIYNTRRDGSDMYWYVYYAPTPAEREQEQKARLDVRGKSRIEM
jgi:hypothetical protein